MKITNNPLFLAAMSASLCIPAIVLPLTAEAAVGKVFTDVSMYNTHYEPIHVMQDQGIISGYPDGTFKPQETISRKHMAALVNRATKLPKVKTAKNFIDVSKNNPYYNDIKAMQQAGIFDADRQGNVYPNKPATRSEMAKALVIAFSLTGSTTKTFQDIDATHPNFNFIQILHANDITYGDNGKFHPNQTLTRAHFSAFMYRTLAKVTKPLADGDIHYTMPFLAIDYTEKEWNLFPLINSQLAYTEIEAVYDHPIFPVLHYGAPKPLYYLNYLTKDEYYYSPWIAQKNPTTPLDDSSQTRLSNDDLQQLLTAELPQHAAEVLAWIEQRERILYNPFYNHHGTKSGYFAKKFGDHIIQFTTAYYLSDSTYDKYLNLTGEALIRQGLTYDVSIFDADLLTPILTRGYQPIEFTQQQYKQFMRTWIY